MTDSKSQDKDDKKSKITQPTKKLGAAFIRAGIAPSATLPEIRAALGAYGVGLSNVQVAEAFGRYVSKRVLMLANDATVQPAQPAQAEIPEFLRKAGDETLRRAIDLIEALTRK